MEPEDIAQNFRISRKCQNKFDCLIFEMFFMKELKPTLNKQCASIRAKLFVQNILAPIISFYFFPLYIFNTFLYILSHFSVRHIFIDFNLFQHIYANLKIFTHLKMTSERSKRRDFLALVFISKSISKKLIIKKIKIRKFCFSCTFKTFTTFSPSDGN